MAAQAALGGAAQGAAMGSTFGPWGTVIGGAIGLIGGILGGSQQDAQARIQAAQQQAQYTISSAQAQAQNLINQNNALSQNALMSSNNMLAGAQEQANLYIKSLNNQRSLKVSGEAYNQLQETIGRYSDDYLRGSFQTRLQVAEALGRQTAEMSAAGVGGTTAQLVNRTMRLQAGQAEEENRIGNRSAMWEFAKQRAGMSDGLLNGANYMLNRDFSGYQAGEAYAQTIVGPVAPTGGGSVGNSGVLNGILGAASNINWSNMGSAVKDIYSSYKTA